MNRTAGHLVQLHVTLKYRGAGHDPREGSAVRGRAGGSRASQEDQGACLLHALPEEDRHVT